MSSLCCINFKCHKLNENYAEYNQLAQTLIQYALDNDFAIFFNSYDYGEDLIKDANMQSFITISDSFLYKQSDELLDNTSLIKYLEFNNICLYKEAFYKKYKKLKKVISIIFNYNVSLVEFYITESMSSDTANFKTKECTVKDFLRVLCDSVLYDVESGNQFPNLKLLVHNQ